MRRLYLFVFALSLLSCNISDLIIGECCPSQEAGLYSDIASVASAEYNTFFLLNTKSNDSPVVDSLNIIPLGNDSSLYVVNFCDDKGFVVISSDLQKPLTYLISESGFFDGTTTGIPPLDYCLSRLTSEISYMESTLPETKAPVRVQHQFDTTVFVDTCCEPLCSVEWHQDAPFNDCCPTYYGVSTPAGCVPIAIAQSMLK